ANEQTRAFRAMTNQVAQLRTELNGAGQSMSRMERARMWGGNVTAFAGGIAAAGAIVAPSVSNQMTYQQRLANMANTAFADDNLAGRQAGMKSMDTLIRRAVAVGGGNKESAAETLDTLLASGAVDYKSAERLLPTLQKYSTASGADAKDLAQIAIRLKQSFGITDEQIPTALNMAIKSGQLGSFELKDQAKWLPQQLAAGNALGMRGLGDLAVLLGINQASAITAGSTDEAGNNVVNLLAKINSQDAATSAAKIVYNGKGIDLPGSLVAARGKGINALDAFSGIVDKIVNNNPAYQKLEKQLSSTSDGSTRREIMESQAKLLEGSAVGKIIADRQALMALIAYRANRGYMNDVVKGVNTERNMPVSQQAGEQNFDLIQGTNLYKVNQLNNTRDFAQMDSIQPLSDVLGKLSGELNDYASAYPGLTKALAGAETAIKAMAAAAWAFAGIKILSDMGNGGSSIPGGGPGGGRTPRTGGSFGRMLRGGLRIAGPLAAVFAADDLNDQFNSVAGDASKAGTSTGEFLVREKQRREQNKQPLFDFDFSSWWSSPQNIRIPQSANGYPVPPFAQQPAAQTPINITTQLQVDGRVLAEVVNEANGQSAARGPQGGPH
ncbi:phage tail tape measure protein, partial [Klebsiella pneumoniae]|nr:phage tail tape measure protein [Klebsiella pneumoniae]